MRRVSLGCGAAQQGAAQLSRVRRSSDSSASACCTAGPSSNPGSAPQGGPLLAKSNEETATVNEQESHRIELHIYETENQHLIRLQECPAYICPYTVVMFRHAVSRDLWPFLLERKL